MDADIEVPEVEIEVVAIPSHKVPVRCRASRPWHALTRAHTYVARNTNGRIHYAPQVPPSGLSLNAVSTETAETAWRILTGAPTSTEGRTFVLAEAAKSLECEALVMCATPSGWGMHHAEALGTRRMWERS
ncbi:hypothetical protein OG21DRAFT_1517159 [Imleria badia]|nr:hypothetical protein OG21DRAFT_1517159 [Imleria badia]